MVGVKPLGAKPVAETGLAAGDDFLPLAMVLLVGAFGVGLLAHIEILAFPAGFILKPPQEIRDSHNGLSAKDAEREDMARVAGDDVITLSGGGAFQYPVVGRFGPDDIDRFNGSHSPGASA